MLYRMETLLPEVVPPKFRDLDFEEITTQGSYIRLFSMMIIEGIINNVLTLINCQTALQNSADPKIH